MKERSSTKKIQMKWDRTLDTVIDGPNSSSECKIPNSKDQIATFK